MAQDVLFMCRILFVVYFKIRFTVLSVITMFVRAKEYITLLFEVRKGCWVSRVLGCAEKVHVKLFLFMSYGYDNDLDYFLVLKM